MAHGGWWVQVLPEMLECEFGAIPGDGAEGQGGRGDAGLEPDRFALVGFLFILEAVAAEVATVRSGEGTSLPNISVERLSQPMAFVFLTCVVSTRNGYEERRLPYPVSVHQKSIPIKALVLKIT